MTGCANTRCGSGIECAREELKTLEGRNELSQEFDDGRIENWKSDRAAEAEARQIVKESVENRGAWREGQGSAVPCEA
jgi:CRISPR/Cas system Type II protein with McrA/HNH and RuvC-like nuclease domain